MQMKAVLFDMDGLMLDSERVYLDAYEYAGQQMKLGSTRQLAYQTIGTNQTRCREILQEQLGEAVDVTQYEQHVVRFVTEYQQKNPVQPKIGLKELLEYLHKHHYLMAVVSSTYVEKIKSHLTAIEVLSYFDAVVGGDLVSRSKPQPDIYLEGARQVGIAPQHCLALEDSRNGLWAAHQAGCHTIMIPDLWQPDTETSKILTAKFDTLLEVIPFLESISQ